MGNKLTSRKFWIAVGGAAAGVGTLVAGINAQTELGTMILSIVGPCLAAISIIAYCFSEAYVDGKAAATLNTDLNIYAEQPEAIDKLMAEVPMAINVPGSGKAE